MVSTLSPPVVVGLLVQDYRYTSVATQIIHDAGLTPIHLPGIERGTAACEGVSDCLYTMAANCEIITNIYTLI